MATSTHPAPQKSGSVDTPLVLNWLMLASLWGVFFIQLSNEWWINEQYNYGLFITFIGAYLIYLRWQDRPNPSNETRVSLKAAVGMLALILLSLTLGNIVFWANVDWRRLLWSEGLILFLSTIFLLRHWGGRSWVAHFAPAFILFLFGIPWPHALETKLVQGLMGFVAMMTVEVLNLLGIFAIQQGNSIALATGTVSVEEACSGVRSFQSTIMAGYFLGELIRFRLLHRILILALAGTFSLFYNFCRTFLLTWLANEYGMETLERWHDSAGYFVFLASFATLALLCYVIKISHTHSVCLQEKQTINALPNWLSTKTASIFLALILCIGPVTLIWYSLRSDAEGQAPNWTIQWQNAASDVEFKVIPKNIKNVLFYSDGTLANWITPSGKEWLVYFFKWDSAEAAQLSGFHNPELCLPAVGWMIEGGGKDLIWEKRGLKLIFNTYTFTAYNHTIYVFNCEWDPSGYPYYQKMGRLRDDRLYDAWIGDRKAGKKTLEIITTGYSNLNEAQNEVIDFLEKSVEIIRTP